MRVSVDSSDAGYATLLSRGLVGDPRVEVYLDDVRLSSEWVLTADEEQGVVVVARRDRLGHVVSDPSRRGWPLTEERRGRVRVVLPGTGQARVPDTWHRVVYVDAEGRYAYSSWYGNRGLLRPHWHEKVGRVYTRVGVMSTKQGVNPCRE